MMQPAEYSQELITYYDIVLGVSGMTHCYELKE